MPATAWRRYAVMARPRSVQPVLIRVGEGHAGEVVHCQRSAAVPGADDVLPAVPHAATREPAQNWVVHRAAAGPASSARPGAAPDRPDAALRETAPEAAAVAPESTAAETSDEVHSVPLRLVTAVVVPPLATRAAAVPPGAGRNAVRMKQSADPVAYQGAPQAAVLRRPGTAMDSSMAGC